MESKTSSGVLAVVGDWARELKYEIDSPDLWAEIEKYGPTFSLAPPEKLTDDPIPAYEVDQITDQLKLLGTELNNRLDLTAEQQRLTDSRVTYLIKVVKTQGRFTWVHTCIGVFVTMAFTLALPPDIAQELWRVVQTFLGRFLYLAPG